ncbi:hypothetical protein ACWDRR_20175 [Kitasatospora sp. NPDC003701]
MATSVTATTTDPVLCDRLARDVTRRDENEELTRRHGRAAPAHSRVLGGERQNAPAGAGSRVRA